MKQYNLIMNPSFETNTLFWGTGGTPTLAQTAVQAFTRTSSGLLTANTNADSCYSTLADAGNLTIGQQYILSAYLYGSGTIRLWVYNGVADVSGSDITLTTTWTRYSFVFTAQATTGVLGGIRLFATNAVTCYIDGVMLQADATLADYFDGSFANCSWNGTADNSYSIKQGTTYGNAYRYGSVGDGMGRSESWT